MTWKMAHTSRPVCVCCYDIVPKPIRKVQASDVGVTSQPTLPQDWFRATQISVCNKTTEAGCS